MPEQGWFDDPEPPGEARFEVEFPPAPPLRPTPAPPPATLVPLPLSVRAADRLRALPWWVRFVLPALAAFALVAGIGDLTKGSDDQRTATAGTVASTTTALATTTTRAPAPTATASRSATTAPTTATSRTTAPPTTTAPAARDRPIVTVPTTPTVPVPITSPKAADTGPGTDSGPGGDATPYYASCAEARSAGAAPLLRGLPGYRTGLDPDGDGIACED